MTKVGMQCFWKYSVYKNQSNDGDGVVFLKSVNSKYPNDPKKHEIFLIILKMTP